MQENIRDLNRLAAACSTHQRGALLPRDLIAWLGQVTFYSRGTDSDIGKLVAGATGHDPDVPLSALALVLADRARRRWADHDEALANVKDAARRRVHASQVDLGMLRQFDTAEGAAAIKAHNDALEGERRVIQL